MDCGLIEIGQDTSLITRKRPEPEPEPETKPSLDEVLNSVSLETREGRKKALAAVTDEMFTNDAKGMWSAWLQSMYGAWQFTPSESQKKAAVKYFTDRGLNWMRHQNYNDARIFCVRQNIFPPHLLTEDEKLSFEIDDMDTSRMTFEQRQALKSSLKRLAPAEQI